MKSGWLVAAAAVLVFATVSADEHVVETCDTLQVQVATGSGCDSCTIPTESDLPQLEGTCADRSTGTCTNADFIQMFTIVENGWANYWEHMQKAQCSDDVWTGSCYAQVISPGCARCRPSYGGPCGATYESNPNPCTAEDRAAFEATPMAAGGDGLSGMTGAERNQLATTLSASCLECVLYANILWSQRGGGIIGDNGPNRGYCMTDPSATPASSATPAPAPASSAASGMVPLVAGLIFTLFALFA
eukprot:SAG31_NODE_63_length_28659_cov_23.074685_13_plen_246_part_00